MTYHNDSLEKNTTHNKHPNSTTKRESITFRNNHYIRIRIRIRIYLLAGRNLLWDILRLPSSRRAALGLYVILTLWRTRGANQPPYASLHRSSPRYALRHGRRDNIVTIFHQWYTIYQWIGVLINYIPEEKCKISFISPPLLTQKTDLQPQGEKMIKLALTINIKINYNLIWVIST